MTQTLLTINEKEYTQAKAVDEFGGGIQLKTVYARMRRHQITFIQALLEFDKYTSMRKLLYKGEMTHLSDIAKDVKLSASRIAYRLDVLKMSLEEALDKKNLKSGTKSRKYTVGEGQYSLRQIASKYDIKLQNLHALVNRHFDAEMTDIINFFKCKEDGIISKNAKFITFVKAQISDNVTYY